MQFSKSLSALLLTLLPISTLALPTEVKLPHLPRGIRDDLLKRHPSTYQVGGFGDLSARDVQGLLETHAQRRGRLEGRASQNDGLKTRCTTSACMALTFDDGPYKFHKELDITLNNAGVHATYFLNGYNYDCIYEADQVSSLRRSLKAGHQLASHTWSHVHLGTQSHAQIDKQVELVETALMKIVGVVPAFIRPPYGECDQDCVNYLNDKHDLVVVNWTTDSGDSQGYSVDQSLDVYRGFKAPKHEIVLNHEVYQSTVEQLIPQAIPILKQNGYKNFVTVAEGLKLNPYKVQGAHGSRDSSWTCDGTPVPGQD